MESALPWYIAQERDAINVSYCDYKIGTMNPVFKTTQVILMGLFKPALHRRSDQIRPCENALHLYLGLFFLDQDVIQVFYNM